MKSVDRLQPGCDWETYIDEGIHWASSDPATGYVVLLMTPHSVRKDDGYCLNELARAIHRKLTVIPIKLIEVPIPLSITRIQFLDMRNAIPISEHSVAYHGHFEDLILALESGRIYFDGFSGPSH